MRTVLLQIITSIVRLCEYVELFFVTRCEDWHESFIHLLYMIQREYQMNNGFSTGEEDSRGNSDQICCLVDDGERCRRPAGNASYSKRIQKTVALRRLKLNIDAQARHTYICDHHKAMIQCARTKQRRPKDSDNDSNEAEMDAPEVDWFQLQLNTLRRYKRHYKVQTRPGLNKAQLADAIQKHFKSLPVNEKEIMTYFIYMVKTNGNKLDQKNGMNSDSV